MLRSVRSRRAGLALGSALLVGLVAGCSAAPSDEPGVPSQPGGAGSGGAAGGGSGGGGVPHGGHGGTSGGTGGTGGTGGSAGAAGEAGTAGTGGTSGFGRVFGAICAEDAQCQSGQCTDIGQSVPRKVCTTPCDGGCRSGAYCAFQADDGFVCIPDNGANQCAVCTTNADCPRTGDVCVRSPLGDAFCARDCSFDATCPAASTCVAPSSYDPSSTPHPVGMGTPGVCVPEGGQSCSCNAARNGATRQCSAEYQGKTCGGLETCNGSTGAWEGCTAAAPSDERCDGVDNDCDGTRDNGTGPTLCAGEGTVRHGAWACEKGACVVGACDDGWARYPATLPVSAGCSCSVESTDAPSGVANDTCASAVYMGGASDGAANQLIVRGRLTRDDDVDWYVFDTVDESQTSNSYHVQIGFAQQASNEFVFEVVRGGGCAAPDAAHSTLTSYDWCVEGQGTTASGAQAGMEGCADTGRTICKDFSTPYYVAVRRRPGVAGTCEEYTLVVTAGAGGGCDYGGSCDARP